MASLIEVRNLSFSFEKLPVLKDASFKVHKKEIVVIVGRSGSGKTTVLRVLAGLLKPNCGTVTVFDQNGCAIPRACQRITYVQQSPALLPWLTVRANILLPDAIRYQPSNRDADQIIRQCQLESTRDFHPAQLSGGMKQRVAFARGMYDDTPIFLLDEPFSANDQSTKKSLLDLLIQHRDFEDRTIVFVTHDLFEALYIADRFFILAGAKPTRIQEFKNPSPTSERNFRFPAAAQLTLMRKFEEALDEV